MPITEAVLAFFRRAHWSFHVAVAVALALGAWYGYASATGGTAI